MKKIILCFFAVCISLAAHSQDSLRQKVRMETNMGNIVIELYNETPKHRDNFLKLVRAGFYDGVLFHRVIKDFMIQAGDPASKQAEANQLLGDSNEPYSVPAEICFPKLFHKRGALAAAREGDDVNPERKSSAFQFYIVYGQEFNEPMLDRVQQRIDKYTDGTVQLTPELREVYKTLGGTPHLDGQYTVYGEVVEGLDIVEKIQAVETDANDRPVKDVKIIKAEVIE